jgi:hypothetical protein
MVIMTQNLIEAAISERGNGFDGGEGGPVKVSMKLVGVVKKDKDCRWASLCDFCDLKRCPAPCASLVGEG